MRSILCLYFVCVFILACKRDTRDIDPALLVGQWRFDNVLRNGRPSSTLHQGYMIFDAGGLVESNIFQSGLSQQYELVGSNLSIIGEDAMNLTITKLTKDTCEMKGKVWLFDMEFTLLKDSDSTSSHFQ